MLRRRDIAGKGRCALGQYGYACANGMLIPNGSVAIDTVRDGTTFTIMVGEQSGWMKNGTTLVDSRSSSMAGAFYGANFNTVPANGNNWDSTSAGNARAWSITTVRYPIGERTMSSTASAGLVPASATAGCCYTGTNHPIQSIHRGGAFVLRVDGGTKFVSDGLEMGILRQLACRDDKAVNKQNPLE